MTGELPAELPADFGDYRLETVLGRGGMGTVYRATHRRLGRACAVKVLGGVPGPTEDGDVRFQRERRTLARLSHPNVVRIYEAGNARGLDFFAMELVDGPTLREAFRRLGRLTVSEALWVGGQILEALAYLHGEGVVHRDIKPGNLMVHPAGLLKVADFGLTLDSTATRLTRHGTRMGTVAYMAPEMLLHGRADARSDLFQWGLVLWEGLAGRPPRDVEAIFDAHAELRPVADLGGERDDLPGGLTAIVTRCTRQQPDERPPCARTVGEALEVVDDAGEAGPGRLLQCDPR